MFSTLFGTNPLDDLIDKATSENIPSNQEDIALNLEICDQVRSKTFNPKDVINSLRRRLRHVNPNVQLLALALTDTCVKNGGNHFLVEVASRVFMDDLVSIIKHPAGINPQVKNRILECIQTWSTSFKDRHELSYTSQVYGALKAQGYTFPPLESLPLAMIDTKTAPEWTDSDVCMRCRTAFTFTNRKHHCRSCGQTFCQTCSSNNIPLPQFGISDAVRVCTGCYLGMKKVSNESASLSLSEFISTENPPPITKDYIEPGNAYNDVNSSDFDADLKKAIELSLKESGGGVQHESSQHLTSSASSAYPSLNTVSAKEPVVNQPIEEEDPDLAAAIQASLRDLELKDKASEFNSTSNGPTSYYSTEKTKVVRTELPAFNLSDKEIQNLTLFPKLIEAMGRNGQITDPSIHALYVELSGLATKMELSIRDSTVKHANFVELQAKLTQAVKLYDSLLEKSLYKSPYVLTSPHVDAPSAYGNTHYNPYPQLNDTTANYPPYSGYNSDATSSIYPNAPSGQSSYIPPNGYPYNQPPAHNSSAYPYHNQSYEPQASPQTYNNSAPLPGAPTQYFDSNASQQYPPYSSSHPYVDPNNQYSQHPQTNTQVPQEQQQQQDAPLIDL